MTYIATFRRFHITYTHDIEATTLDVANILALEDLAVQRRKNHPSIELVKVEVKP